ncbi:6803_t:CDS:2, partial [Rhizophagus irregularis]
NTEPNQPIQRGPSPYRPQPQSEEDGNIYDSRGNEIKDHLDKYMFVPTKSNNKGFEMPDSKTVLSSKEIKEKYKHMKDKYLPHVNQKRQSKESPVRKLRMEIGDIYLILVVWRDI